MTRPFFVLAALATAGCSTYAFVPVSPPAQTVKAFERDAAYYAIPAEGPHGDLRVVSYGVEKIVADDTDVRTLHVRVIVENTGQKPWTFDTREQELAIDGRGAESPAFAASDPDGALPPLVDLHFGVMRTIDLFYPLPDDVTASEIPAFREITKVHTDEGAVVETTPFERIEVGMLSPYAQDDVVAEGGYDYLDATFWINAGGVAFGGGRHPARERVFARGRGTSSGSSSSSSSGSGRSGGHSRITRRGATHETGGHVSGGRSRR